MCGRYTLELTFAELVALWDIYSAPPEEALRAMLPNYNIAPTQAVPVVRPGSSGRELQPMRWGLVPFFAHGVPGKYATHNARLDTLTTSPSYRAPWKRGQRCIVPASSYYEWQVLPGDAGKQPYRIGARDQRVFGFAGLWDASTREDGETLLSCTIITMGAGPLVGSLHNRMPAILEAADVDAWLSGTPEQAHALLKQYPDERLQWWPVSKRVNTARNNGPELVVPVVQAGESE